MVKPAELEALEKEKRASVGQLLFKCARLLDERAIARVNRAIGQPPLRPAHTNLFPHIDFAGTRLSDIARRIGITKQAVGQLVADLAARGVVELLDDPADGRAKLVRFTAAGTTAIRHGLEVLRSIEAELGAEIGEQNMRALHRALLALLPALERPDHTREDDAGDTRNERHRSAQPARRSRRDQSNHK
jgi:DNA-binding MarR family transcriptional regulator